MGGLNLSGFVLFILLVAVPAWYINRWMIKLTRPRESFKRLFLYILLSIVIALTYAGIFILILTSIYPLPKK
ncbi:MAG: hypothetical protein J0L56_01540 [Chitinophagales bacterium]|nr:hypothetical protein [Chitinophagales bacterium]